MCAGGCVPNSTAEDTAAGAQLRPEAASVQENQQRDRDWEHWPGRKGGDDGIRHRLRALFSATDDDGLEARIAEKGREIEEHADQLQATIGDLERREARAAQLRIAVEEMLRQGSAELDERHAGLTQLSLELGAREERIRADERDIAVRKQELGAVELRRAAVERREAVASQREAELDRTAADLEERERTVSEHHDGAPGSLVSLTRVPAGASQFDGSLLLLGSPAGYAMIDRPDVVVTAGSSIQSGGLTYSVIRVGRSPLVGDRRCWAYLEAAGSPPAA
jgi:hypothetical protein